MVETLVHQKVLVELENQVLLEVLTHCLRQREDVNRPGQPEGNGVDKIPEEVQQQLQKLPSREDEARRRTLKGSEVYNHINRVTG